MVQTRVTEKVGDDFEMLSKLKGMPVATYVRVLIMRELEANQVTPLKTTKKG